MLRDSLKAFNHMVSTLKVSVILITILLTFTLSATAETGDLQSTLDEDSNALAQSDDSGFMIEDSDLVSEDSNNDDGLKLIDEVQVDAVAEDDSVILYGAPDAPAYATHLLNPERTAALEPNNYNGTTLLPMKKSWSKGLRSFGDRFKRRSDGVLSRPVIYEGKLFTGSAKRRLYGFDIERGKTLWSFKAKSDIIASPSVMADMLCFGTEGGVFHCLNTDTGEELWNTKVKGEILSSPIFTSEAVYFTSTDNRIHAFDRHSGERIWVYTHSSISYVYPRIISSPAYSNERLFVLFGDGVMVALHAKSGRVGWKERILKDSVASMAYRKTPLIYGDRVYVIDDAGRVLSLSVSDGRRLQVYSTQAVSDFTITDDTLYMTAGGQVEAVDMRSNAILWRALIEDNADGRAIAVRGEHIVLVSNGDHKPWGITNLTKRVGYLSILSRNTGERLWNRRLKSQVRSEPYLDDNYLAIVTIKGRLNVFTARGEGS